MGEKWIEYICLLSNVLKDFVNILSNLPSIIQFQYFSLLWNTIILIFRIPLNSFSHSVPLSPYLFFQTPLSVQIIYSSLFYLCLFLISSLFLAFSRRFFIRSFLVLSFIFSFSLEISSHTIHYGIELTWPLFSCLLRRLKGLKRDERAGSL